MCSVTELKNAADKLANPRERKQVNDIAKRLARGKAKDHELAWAKRITVGVRKAAGGSIHQSRT